MGWQWVPDHDWCSCPDCKGPRGLRDNPWDIGNDQCTLGKPMWMVIYPPGMWLECPVHGRHWIASNQPTYTTTY